MVNQINSKIGSWSRALQLQQIVPDPSLTHLILYCEYFGKVSCKATQTFAYNVLANLARLSGIAKVAIRGGGGEGGLSTIIILEHTTKGKGVMRGQNAPATSREVMHSFDSNLCFIWSFLI